VYHVLLFRNSFGREAQFRTRIVSKEKIFGTVYRSVLDPHWFNPDPAFYRSAEPDPGSQNNADPDPVQNFKSHTVKNILKEGIRSKNIHAKRQKAFLKAGNQAYLLILVNFHALGSGSESRTVIKSTTLVYRYYSEANQTFKNLT
jgi:hypothetical protein